MTYEYTLNDLYTIFRETDEPLRPDLLSEWSKLNLPYDINFENLIEAWGGLAL